MITAKEAYNIMKETFKIPITQLIEADERFLGISEEYLSVMKISGEFSILEHFTHFIDYSVNGKYVYLREMFDDYLVYYRENASERNLAKYYAWAWNQLFYSKGDSVIAYKNDEEREKIVSHWTMIEQELYAKIRKIIDNEDVDYPPTVLNKFDDPFYRIKPFMLRNGWTDDKNSRTWVIYTSERL